MPDCIVRYWYSEKGAINRLVFRNFNKIKGLNGDESGFWIVTTMPIGNKITLRRVKLHIWAMESPLRA